MRQDYVSNGRPFWRPVHSVLSKAFHFPERLQLSTIEQGSSSPKLSWIRRLNTASTVEPRSKIHGRCQRLGRCPASNPPPLFRQCETFAGLKLRIYDNPTAQLYGPPISSAIPITHSPNANACGFDKGSAILSWARRLTMPVHAGNHEDARSTASETGEKAISPKLLPHFHCHTPSDDRKGLRVFARFLSSWSESCDGSLVTNECLPRHPKDSLKRPSH